MSRITRLSTATINTRSTKVYNQLRLRNIHFSNTLMIKYNLSVPTVINIAVTGNDDMLLVKAINVLRSYAYVRKNRDGSRSNVTRLLADDRMVFLTNEGLKFSIDYFALLHINQSNIFIKSGLVFV